VAKKQRTYAPEQYYSALKLLREGLSMYKVAKILGIPRSTLRHWKCGCVPPSARWEPKPSPELAYVIGALLGDGCVYSTRSSIYGISLAAKDIEFVEQFSKCIAIVLGKRYRVPRRYRNLWRVTYFSNTLRSYVEYTPECVKMFLRGIYDAEGYHYSTQRREKITLGNKNITLLRYVQYLLWQYFSIIAYITIASRKSSVYSLVIGRKSFVKRFLTEIGFTITRRQRPGLNSLNLLNRGLGCD